MILIKWAIPIIRSHPLLCTHNCLTFLQLYWFAFNCFFVWITFNKLQSSHAYCTAPLSQSRKKRAPPRQLFTERQHRNNIPQRWWDWDFQSNYTTIYLCLFFAKPHFNTGIFPFAVLDLTLRQAIGNNSSFSGKRTYTRSLPLLLECFMLLYGSLRRPPSSSISPQLNPLTDLASSGSSFYRRKVISSEQTWVKIWVLSPKTEDLKWGILHSLNID